MVGSERVPTVWRITSSQGVSFSGLMLPSPTTATMRTASSGDVAWPATPPIPGEQATQEKRRVAELEGASKGEVLGRWNRFGWKTRTAADRRWWRRRRSGEWSPWEGVEEAAARRRARLLEASGTFFLVTGLSRSHEPFSSVRSSIDGPR
jgi:hypothetical protein